MASLFRLSNLWRLFPQAAVKESGETKERRVRNIVKSLINGNVSMRAGHYITEAQITEKRKKIVRHKFI